MFSSVFDFIILGAILFVIFRQVFNQQVKVRWKMSRMKTKRIDAVIDGDIIKIVGKAEAAGELLKAPLSGRPCVAYAINVERYYQNGKNSFWKSVFKEKKLGDFVITQGMKVAFLNKVHIENYFVEDSIKTFDKEPLLPADLLEYLKTKGLELKNWQIRIKEGVILEKEEVAASGQGYWAVAEDLNLPSNYWRVLELRSYARNPVYFSDDSYAKKERLKSNKDVFMG